MSLDVPVLFIVFNRPEVTKITFDRIRQAKPLKLYITADGPRLSKAGEKELTLQVREITSRVDWNCEVKTRYLEENLGCKMGVSSGISWFFDHELEGIILEDDCLPDLSFFPYCKELLSRYRHDERVMHISGVHLLPKAPVDEGDYYFSYYGHIWGWAGWRRAWKHMDVHIKTWPEIRAKKLHYNFFDTKAEAKVKEKHWDSVHSGNFNTWDYQWLYARFMQSGLSITPTKNLVTNIGFGTSATHTSNADSLHASLPLESIELPLGEKSHVVRDRKADALYFKSHYPITKFNKVKRRVKNLRTKS